MIELISVLVEVQDTAVNLILLGAHSAVQILQTTNQIAY